MDTSTNDIDKYIASFPAEVQILLKQVRAIIKTAAPDAEEKISYGMPGYKMYGKPLVYFAAFAKHIGFYALPSGHNAFADELSGYKQGKGSVQFPINEPLPLELIARIVIFRMNENHLNAKK